MPEWNLVNDEEEAISELKRPLPVVESNPERIQWMKKELAQRATRMGFGERDMDVVTGVNKGKELMRSVSFGLNGQFDPDAASIVYENYVKKLPSVKEALRKREQREMADWQQEEQHRTAALSKELRKKYGVDPRGAAPKGTAYAQADKQSKLDMAEEEFDSPETEPGTELYEFGTAGSKQYINVSPTDFTSKAAVKGKLGAKVLKVKGQEQQEGKQINEQLPSGVQKAAQLKDGYVKVTYTSKDGSVKTKRLSPELYKQMIER